MFGCEVMNSGCGKLELVVDRIRGDELKMFRQFADKLSKREVRELRTRLSSQSRLFKRQLSNSPQ